MRAIFLLGLTLGLFLPYQADAGVLLKSRRTTTQVRTPRAKIARARASTFAANRTAPSLKVTELSTPEQEEKIRTRERKQQLKVYKRQVKLAEKAYKKKQDLRRKREAEYKKLARQAQKKRKAQLEREKRGEEGENLKTGPDGKPEKKQSWIAKFFGTLFSKPEPKDSVKKSSQKQKTTTGESELKPAEAAKF